jgi:hypothetical protein
LILSSIDILSDFFGLGAKKTAGSSLSPRRSRFAVLIARRTLSFGTLFANAGFAKRLGMVSGGHSIGNPARER